METITRLWNTPSAGMFMSTTSGSIIRMIGRWVRSVGLPQPVVLLRRAAHDGGGIDRVAAPRDRLQVEHRVVAGQRVVPGVIAERALQATLRRIHPALAHDVGLRGDGEGH